MACKSIFLDSDVLLDFLEGREPFFKNAADVIQLIATGEIKGFTSPIIVANIYYLLRKKHGDAQTRAVLQALTSYIRILPVEEVVVKAALQSDFTDFEDALQHEAALISGKVEVILTRNLKDYKKAKLPVMTPEGFLLYHNA